MKEPVDIYMVNVNGIKYGVEELPKSAQELLSIFNLYNKRIFQLQRDVEMAIIARDSVMYQINQIMVTEQNRKLEAVKEEASAPSEEKHPEVEQNETVSGDNSNES